ncbi:MAG TPA: class I SAM-dependent methyltransferase [Vicinamibacterales bacterium]|nr:class I SAM-dependent methyltransferase [Vicinamibacterales bacterium]
MKAAPLEARAAYALWADTYPAVAHNPLMRIEQSVVEPILAHLRGARALDVGTGSGRYLPLLRATGAVMIAGVDFSIAMLGRAARGATVCGDACLLPFRRSAFDIVNASLMVGDVDDLDTWTHEMARVLVPGGHLVYSDFHPSWAQHGWSRTFRTAAGAIHDVAFHAHSIDGHLTALERAGLRVRTIREPRFSDDGDAAVQAFRRQWGNPPVVVVFHAVKEP